MKINEIALYGINYIIKITDALPSDNKIQKNDKECWNGSESRIYCCNNKTCKFKYVFQPSDKILVLL